jgi:hypothetical protein
MVGVERFVRFSVDGAVNPTVRILIIHILQGRGSTISSMRLFRFVSFLNATVNAIFNTPGTITLAKNLRHFKFSAIGLGPNSPQMKFKKGTDCVQPGPIT